MGLSNTFASFLIIHLSPRLKSSNLVHFQSIEMYRRVLSLLEAYRYRSPVRRFILELFDKKVVERIVKGNKDGNPDTPSSKYAVPAISENP